MDAWEGSGKMDVKAIENEILEKVHLFGHRYVDILRCQILQGYLS